MGGILLENVIESLNKEVAPECVWNMQEHTGAGLNFLVILGQKFLKNDSDYTILSKNNPYVIFFFFFKESLVCIDHVTVTEKGSSWCPYDGELYI